MVQYDRVEPVRVVLSAVDKSENLRAFVGIRFFGGVFCFRFIFGSFFIELVSWGGRV